jgi:hypothetical protein
MTRLERMKQIVANGQSEKVDGMWVDISSANVYVTIYEALNETNQGKLDKMGLYNAMRMCWDLSVR